VYDPRTGQWTRTGGLATARSAHTATLLADGRVLVAGGSGQYLNRLPASRAYLQSAELYDPATGRWAPAQGMTSQRSDFAAVLLLDGTVLAMGGDGRVALPGDDVPRVTLLSSAELYDPGTGRWAPTPAMTVARDVHSATLLADGRVLVVGWLPPGDPGGPVASWEIYDPSSRRWSSNGTIMVTARWNQTATRLPSGKVLVAGGVRYEMIAAAEVFDPATGEWTATAEMSEARVGHTATLLSSGAVLVTGGAGDLEASATAELYDPEPGFWTKAPGMETSRVDHTATLLQDGRVLVAGGQTGSWDAIETTASAELYDSGSGPLAAPGASGTQP
jgi:hypothetical protein